MVMCNVRMFKYSRNFSIYSVILVINILIFHVVDYASGNHQLNAGEFWTKNYIEFDNGD